MNKKRGGEHVLIPAGKGGLTLQELEAGCSKRLARLLENATPWQREVRLDDR